MPDAATRTTQRSRQTPRRARALVEEGGARHRSWILATLAVSQLMVVLDGTLVNIALPTAQRDLAFGPDQRQWVVITYALTFGSLLLLGGRLTDLIGRRRAYLIGLAGFAAASALAGASTGLPMLLIGRAAQGVFGALLAPAALALLATTFTDTRERARAFGVFGAVSGAGGAVGLLLGGALTEYASWRWCLYVNVPIAAAAVLGGALLIGHQPPSADRRRLDLPGASTVTTGLVCLVYGFSSVETRGWADVVTVISFVAAGALLCTFVMIERRATHPLVPLRVVLDRTRGGAYVTIALVAVGLFSVFLFLAYYLQVVRGYSPLHSGVAFLPLPIGLVIAATAITPRLLQRFGFKVPITAGALIGAGALLLLSTTTLTSSYWTSVAPALALLGVGMGNVFSSTFNAATAGTDPRDTGVASAMVNTSQQIGGAVGTAVVSTVANRVLTRYLNTHGTGELAQAQAQLSSFHTAFVVSAVVLLAAGVTAAVLPRGRAAGSQHAPGLR